MSPSGTLPGRRALGGQGEALAWAHLAAHGYRCVARNVRYPAGELDLIALDGEVLCFVEVRSRAEVSSGHPLETIGRAKQRRLVRAAAHYLADHPTDRPCRFDAVSVVFGGPEPVLHLVRGAFDAVPWG